MNLSNTLPISLQTALHDFKAALPSLEELLHTSTFTYGCCEKPIEKEPSKISSTESCPYCADHYESDRNNHKIETPPSWSNGFGKLKAQVAAEYINGKYENIKNADGELLYHVQLDPDNQTLKQLEEKYKDTFKYFGKNSNVKFSNQHKFNTVYKILEMVQKGIGNNSYAYLTSYDSFFNNSGFDFGEAELSLISECGLNEQFVYINTIKQLIYNEYLEVCITMISEKMRRAGMELV